MFLLQRGAGSIPGQGTKILYAVQQKKKEKNFFLKKEGNTQAQGRWEHPKARPALTMMEMTRLDAPDASESRPQASPCPPSATGGTFAGLGRRSAPGSFSGNAFSLSGLGV